MSTTRKFCCDDLNGDGESRDGSKSLRYWVTYICPWKEVVPLYISAPQVLVGIRESWVCLLYISVLVKVSTSLLNAVSSAFSSHSCSARWYNYLHHAWWGTILLLLWRLRLLYCGWWLMVDGWWLMADGLWLTADGWWLETEIGNWVRILAAVTRTGILTHTMPNTWRAANLSWVHKIRPQRRRGKGGLNPSRDKN